MTDPSHAASLVLCSSFCPCDKGRLHLRVTILDRGNTSGDRRPWMVGTQEEGKPLIQSNAKPMYSSFVSEARVDGTSTGEAGSKAKTH